VRLLCAALAALALAGCGSGGTSSVPKGSPDARRGAAAVDAYASIELMRAKLVASSDAYYAGGSAADARRQLARARSAYDSLAERVAGADPVLQREVDARFALLDRNLRRGIQPDHYRDLAGALTDQLLEGVAQTLLKPEARTDPGLQAEVLRRLTARLSGTYDAASAAAGDTTGRLAFQESWGLWRRAQALTALLKQDLGGQKNTVAGALNGLRGTAFPAGPNEPDAPAPAKVDAAGARVAAALSKRFGLDELQQ
jgi:hypothetical protein